MNAQPAADGNFVYPGRELEAMSLAVNYYRWVLRRFKPYLGKHVVEVGAGVGSFTELLLKEHACQILSLVEPSPDMHAHLASNVWDLAPQSQLDTYNGTFVEVAARLSDANPPPDSVLYINVLEHIADDDAELQAVHRTLGPGGRVLIFAPALRWLYGSFDKRVGHFRRYSKTELEKKSASAGFKLVESGYFDFLGIAPWWVKYRLFRSTTMEPGSVRFYDSLVVPAARRVEQIIKPPIGKNVFLVGEKA